MPRNTDVQRVLLHHKLVLNGYLCEFTGQTMETMTKDTDRDNFMSAQEACDYGIIDKVIPVSD